jgi:hypothetical protein
MQTLSNPRAEAALTPDEREAVAVYLKRRFHLDNKTEMRAHP